MGLPKTMDCGCYTLFRYTKSISTELWGVFQGLKLAWDHRFHHLVMEVDSEVIADMLSKPNGVKGYNRLLIDRYIQPISMDLIVEIAHIYREANKATD